MTAHVRVIVAGPLSAAATSAITARYDVVIGPRRAGDETMLDLKEPDQPAIRGLLTLLWDFGHDVVAVANETKERTS